MFLFDYIVIHLIGIRCRIACILGHSSGFPCPICLVPRLEQCQLAGDWPSRTVLSSQRLVERANESTTLEGRSKILHEQSLRDIKVSCAPINLFQDVIECL